MAEPQWTAGLMAAPPCWGEALKGALHARDSKGKSSVKVTKTLTTPAVRITGIIVSIHIASQSS
jgi:hypothetical protein